MNMLIKREKIYTLIAVGIVFLWAALPVAGQTSVIKACTSLNIGGQGPMVGRSGEAKPCIITTADICLLSDTDLTGDNCENTGCISFVFDDNNLFPGPLNLPSMSSENNKNLSSATQLPRPPPSL